MPTQVRLKGKWVDVQGTEMDLVIVVDRERSTARMVPMAEVRRGDAIVVGHEGIRVMPLQRAREREIFSFMASDISSERPKRLVIEEVARQMREIRARGGKILVVAGPAIVHSGAGPYLAKMIRAGFVQTLFGGNAIAAHDVESALLGTSLGVALRSGQPVEGGHRHHMFAINDAAFDRHRKPAARFRQGGGRGHQSRRGHQARRPRNLPGPGPGHRRGVVRARTGQRPGALAKRAAGAMILSTRPAQGGNHAGSQHDFPGIA
jgi:hypothetical protein